MGKAMLGSPAEKLTRRMFTRILGGVARTLAENDLSVAQLAALYLIDEQESLRISDVAAELALSAPTASRMVDDLVRQKLVAREEDATDRRARVLTLTAKGRTFVAKSSEARMETIAKAASEVSAETIRTVWQFLGTRG